MKIKIHHLYTSPGHNYIGRHGIGAEDYPIIENEIIQCIEGRGIKDDRFWDHKPDFKGQITFFDYSVYEKVRDSIVKGKLSPMAFRRNVVVSGVDLNALIDKHFQIGETLFSGSCEAAPCYWMDQACAPGTHEFLKGQGGLRARIVKSGPLTNGEHTLVIPNEN